MPEMIAMKLRLQADCAEDLERFGIDLRSDLDSLRGAEIRPAQGALPPSGSKAGVGIIAWDQILVTLAASGGVLTALIALIQSRLSRERSVKLVIDGDEIEVNGLGKVEQQRLIDVWLARQRDRRSRHG